MEKWGGAITPEKRVLADGVRVFCRHSAIIPLGELKPNPANPNNHPDDQIRKLAYVIEHNGWRNPIVVSTRSGMIVKGHGRLKAAIMLGKSVAPVEYQDYAIEADEYADLMADNRIAELSSIDVTAAVAILESLDDKKAAGFTDSDIASMMKQIRNEQNEEKYTKLKDVPQYIPTGECPEPGDLFDDEKAKRLIGEVERANIHDDVKAFLILASYRHVVFNFKNIAEYYAHADKDVQELFEKNAVVIIDYEDALKYGYIDTVKEIDELMEEAFEDA